MTAVVIGLLSVSAGAAYSVSFGGVLVGDVLMGFGLFAGIKGLICMLLETLRGTASAELAVVSGRPVRQMSRQAVRPMAHLRPLTPQAAALRRHGARA